MLGILAVFQLALALGAPLAKLSWGGKYDGTLPGRYRVASLFSAALIVFFGTIIMQQAGWLSVYPGWLSQGIMWGIVIYFGISVIMNGISPSKIERVWSPYSLIMLILALPLLHVW